MKINEFTLPKEEIELEYYGVYRIGLTSKEIEIYLKTRALLPKYRSKFKHKTNLLNKFHKMAGVNTVGMSPSNEMLMYRHDVKRFADALFDNKKTYFD
jgi:hypothetical protein